MGGCGKTCLRSTSTTGYVSRRSSRSRSSGSGSCSSRSCIRNCGPVYSRTYGQNGERADARRRAQGVPLLLGTFIVEVVVVVAVVVVVIVVVVV